MNIVLLVLALASVQVRRFFLSFFFHPTYPGDNHLLVATL